MIGSETVKLVVFITDADPNTENVPLTNRLPETLSVEPSNVRLL
jgi:hypothetical protein